MREIKWVGRIFLLVVMMSALSACVVAGDGVVKAVEGFYVTSKQEVLVVSGNTAAHPVFGIFSVDDPVVLEKVYQGEEGATVVFKSRGEKVNATIRQDEEEFVFEFMSYGGPDKATVFGVYW